MGLILDSSILITAERNREPVEQFLKRVFSVLGDQETAIASVALVEIVHGIYRAKTAEIREQRQLFVQELLADVSVYPLTRQIAFRAGQIDGEQRAEGVKVSFRTYSLRNWLRPSLFRSNAQFSPFSNDSGSRREATLAFALANIPASSRYKTPPQPTFV